MLRHHRKKLTGAAVVLFWLVMMGLLAYRELMPLFLGPSLSASYKQNPTDTWMQIISPQDQPIGFINTQTAPETMEGLPGTRILLNATLKMQFLGQPMRLYMTGAAWIARTGDRGNFDFAVHSQDYGARFEGVIENGALDARLHTAGEVYPISIPMDRELVIGGITGTATLQLSDLAPGEEVVIEAFDPMTLTMGTARVKCLGFETLGEGEAARKTRVVAVTVQDVVTKAWVDEQGETVRAETPFGLTLQRTTSQEAMASLSRETPQDIVVSVAIRPSGMRPSRGAKRMAISVSGLADTASLPEDANQCVLEHGKVVIEPLTPDTAKDASRAPENMAEYLAPHPFIQSDHPDIRQTAADIIENSTNPWEKSVKIHDWVYRNVAKEGVLSIPSALEVLKSRVGDCNEHTVLFAALARSVDIPTRIALGVVWSEELDGFYYHAWPEVFVGEWLWMDPTLGQTVADATHVKLLTGDIERWPRLLPFLGKLRIEVTEVD
ncbi:MAG TPA: transglutaminase-like domain-containing protein [Candidatus Hydrogenedentes bacterium]|nr:transglutaminase-like domain-containing protein [Candidatus Hydrogenedentota bacterium]HQM48975.1 transglutaminase-like domain-containing protein [Candidatus Hydrogenedentota bacterium]